MLISTLPSRNHIRFFKPLIHQDASSSPGDLVNPLGQQIESNLFAWRKSLNVSLGGLSGHQLALTVCPSASIRHVWVHLCNLLIALRRMAGQQIIAQLIRRDLCIGHCLH